MHRKYTQVEQFFTGLEDSALGQLPTGRITANAAT
ncbi:predicted protein [Streptomyces viridosporus ATCC 14672]|uniref:Predicted protein n=1 Tax=Streptomyces viridosporus (strain ATCC 14672 / DSM 40746 / JCM 4963 / KCTC 9882 / NRRL B-12104 / FH 1290) TaxID=566461 RepID=D6A1N5_STRV1|nr:predicted protein [Streptomyces viridosporus ATCC 14672]